MNVEQLAERLSLTMICKGEDYPREISGGVYCCDLLSITMGRAPANGAWVTVMANINAVAVAVLCDLACIVIAEGMEIDQKMIDKAQEQGVTVLKSDEPVFLCAKKIDGCVAP